MTINDLVREAHVYSKSNGFWGVPAGRRIAPSVAAARTPEKLALIHEEVSEALHDWRKDPDFPCWTTDEDGKPIGFPSELADIVIRVCDLAGAFDIDLEAVIRVKMAYNRTRPLRHGDIER